MLLDSGFNLNYVWKVMLMLLKPVLTFANMHTNPMRELRELCQCHGFELGLPKPMKADGEYHVKVEVNIKSKIIICTAANRNSKAARKFAAQETLSKLKVQFCSLSIFFCNYHATRMLCFQLAARSTLCSLYRRYIFCDFSICFTFLREHYLFYY